MHKNFIIEVEMEDRWIPYFMSLLNKMEECGDYGRSRKLQFYSDGDGDFRPKFISNIEWEKVEPIIKGDSILYDAG